MIDVDIQPNETFEKYRRRIYDMKASGEMSADWNTIAVLFYDKFGVLRDESTWRKECKRYLKQSDKGSFGGSNKNDESLENMLFEFKKERIKMSDERVQINAYMRKMSREDTLLEIATMYAKEMSTKKLLDDVKPIITNSNDEGIIMLSDWHYGIEINNVFNVYSPEICKERVNKLLSKINYFYTEHPVKRLYVVNLGDLCSGRIHNTIRIQNRYDVITQCMDVCEILAEFLVQLQSIAPVTYTDCFDNHSRIEANKSDSLELESMTRLIPWYLKQRLDKYPRISFAPSTFNGDIIQLEILGGKYKVAGVHGHKDKINKIVENLTLVTSTKYDLILTAHYHHFEAKEQNETLVISNGTLMGVDDFAYDLRRTSFATQNLILVSEESPAKYIYRVPLNTNKH